MRKLIIYCILFTVPIILLTITFYKNLQPEQNNLSLNIYDNVSKPLSLTIAVIGDVHLPEDNNAIGDFQTLLNEVEMANPDLTVFVGDYISNHRMKSVDIFRMGDDGIWRTAFSFPENTINHIHSLIADPLSESIYVLTGDYGSAASIWKASKNFSVVERVCTPGQEVRACWLSVKGDNLFYATDSHTSINHCMVINIDVCDTLNPIPLHEIPGSSIYFLPSTDSSFVYFSTC